MFIHDYFINALLLIIPIIACYFIFEAALEKLKLRNSKWTINVILLHLFVGSSTTISLLWYIRTSCVVYAKGTSRWPIFLSPNLYDSVWSWFILFQLFLTFWNLSRNRADKAAWHIYLWRTHQFITVGHFCPIAKHKVLPASHCSAVIHILIALPRFLSSQSFPLFKQTIEN